MLAMAVPAKPGVITVQQPDGTSLEILLNGDENFNYVTTTDGYLIKQNNDGYYMYAKYEEGQIIPTELYAKNVAERQNSDVAFLNLVGTADLKKEQLTENWNEVVMARMQATPQLTSQSLNTSSTLATKGLVILVQFSDKSLTYGVQDFDDLLNLEGYSYNGATGCANEYFYSVSNGQYDPHFDVYGPVTLDNTMSYYGGNSSSSGGDIRPAQMFVDAVAKLKSDPNITIDLSDYDSDNDGYVDDVFLFYAGFSEAEGASSSTIWPHRWGLYSYSGGSNYEGTINYDGVELYGYACTAELTGTSGTTKAAIGIFCHEFSHVLGLPDFYSTTTSYHKTCGQWDIMDYGSYNNSSRTPSGYSAHERFYVGWFTPIILNVSGDYQLADILDSNMAYMITSTGTHNLNPTNPSPAEYYLLENRQQTGWDAYLPGSGMMMTKTSYSSSKWSYNTVNNDPDDMGYDIIEADGLNAYSYYYGKAGDLFPGTSNVTSYVIYDDYWLSHIEYTNSILYFTLTTKTECVVTFDAKEYGKENVSSITESSIAAGVSLPGVTIYDDEYTFIGWSEAYASADVDAGVEDEVYYPQQDITLYAVYSKDGEIVGLEEDRTCFVETFDNFNAFSTTDISSDIDYYCDNSGWSGEQISRYNGSARVGLSSVDGYLSTPRFCFTTAITVYVTARGNSSGTLTISIDGTEQSQTIDITSSSSDYVVSFDAIPLASRITFTSTASQLMLDYVAICPEGIAVTSENIEVKSSALSLLYVDSQTRILDNLSVRANVYCFDIAGRLLWSEVANSTQMTFSAPNGFYLIRVIDANNQETVIKGL